MRVSNPRTRYIFQKRSTPLLAWLGRQVQSLCRNEFDTIGYRIVAESIFFNYTSCVSAHAII
jgi:predicted secreted protein